MSKAKRLISLIEGANSRVSRKTINESRLPSVPRIGGDSPWGEIDYLKEFAYGIVEISTAGHGGFWICPDRVKEVAKLVPQIKLFWKNGARNPKAWYEEDEEWAWLGYAYPELFTRVYRQLDAEEIKETCREIIDKWWAGYLPPNK